MYPMNPLTVGQANFSPYYSPLNFNPVVPNYQPVTAPAPSRQIDCVNGRDSALAFQLGPNSSVILADNLEPKIWVVTTDASGYKAIKGYKIIEDEETPNISNGPASDESEQNSKWKETLESFNNRLDKLEERLNEYGQSNTRNAYQSKSGNARTQPDDRNGQSGKGSNGSYQSDGSK